jgi:16S rRNA (guanine966-N2)-methyltransferase
LRAPPGLATRPTAERLRQALFDMLVHAPWGGPLDDRVVLDAFAGTGALGLEALSRGAAHGTFMERDRAALDALRANTACAGAAATVLAADVLRPPPGRACDLVFMDPPYAAGVLPQALAALSAAGWIGTGALLIAESARGESLALGEPVAERAHGAGRVTVWRL